MSAETPLIRQYREIKAQNEDKLLLFRVGDFYEMFYEDARRGARELEITLTSRETGKGNHVPLAGFPFHALDNYLGRLVDRGYKVAICEQVEDAKLAKGLVRREIVRVVTPGTLTETSLLDEKRNNYLAAVFAARGGYGLAAVDVSTGEFVCCELRGRQAARLLSDELCRLQPAELVVNAVALADPGCRDAFARLGREVPVGTVTGREYSFRYAEITLREHFGVNCRQISGLAAAAAGAAVRYLRENQPGGLKHLQTPGEYSPEGFMILDPATRRNLELTRTIREENKAGSLLSVLDRTRTGAGARLLKRWLEQPLLDSVAINRRLDAVEELTGNLLFLEELAEQLDKTSDLERLISRVNCENANARDLVAMRCTLLLLPGFTNRLTLAGTATLRELAGRLPDLSSLAEYLMEALRDDPPLALKEGGLLRDGFHPEVDRLRQARRGGQEYLLGVEQRERERTGIKSLKVSYNRVFGYYMEISRANLHLVPEDYHRKQTLANAERYITPELKEYEALILGAEEKITALEYEAFLAIRERVAEFTVSIQEAAAVLAELDAYQSLARVARDNRYVRPELDDTVKIEITDGRHPVLEKLLPDQLFVPNDLFLDGVEHRVLLITGPNMAGKSTYMRAAALVVILAQLGSFVPARKARIGLVDRIFTRIGAADDLVGGQSTFMVEMSEVAGILNRATSRSLVLLDEVGRGTGTVDGISIARAVVEYLYYKVKARTLFATHYHELTALAAEFPAIRNLATAVKEKGEEIVFLHKVVPGSVDKSYGLQVARLAGLPPQVLERARDILAQLETDGGRRTADSAEEGQLRLFVPDRELSAALDELELADLMTTTPLEAMQLMYRLQQAMKRGKPHG
ncbi:MAG: DNA mismatch repair protein MutS [Syntrophomonadaceae bacterium]|nr:DNA mismatch repair protein MutS [Bacillota bacterium]